MKQIAAVSVVVASCSSLFCFVINITMLFFVKRQANRVAQSLARATIPLVLSYFLRFLLSQEKWYMLFLIIYDQDN